MRAIRSWRAALIAALLTTSSLPAVAAETPGLPPVIDVPEYRADAARSGVYPGPGPISKPVVVWQREGIATTTNPIVAGGMLIAGDASGILYALDVHTGEERWRFDTGSPMTSLAADDTSVLATDEAGALHGLDLATGAERWTAPAPGAVSIAIADGRAYVAGQQVHGFDLSDGSPDWTWEGPAASRFLTVTDDTVYASVDDGRLYAIDRADASERWHVQTISPTVGPAMITPDTVYLMTLSNSTPVPAGELYAIDPETGAVRWRFRSPSGDQVSAGAIGDGVEFSGSIQDGLFAFAEEPDPDGSPEVLWHTDIDGSVYRNASRAGDIVYFPQVNPGAVLAVDATSGELLWSVPVPENPLGLVVTGGMVLSGSENGTLFALAEPDLAAAVGNVAMGPLSPAAAPSVPNPFTITNTIGPETTGISQIVGLAVGPDGDYYVLDYAGRVLVIDPATGAVIREWGRKGTGAGEFDFTRPEGDWGIGAIAVGADGLVYVGDGANHRYQVFEPDGTFVRQVGSYGTEEGQFSRIFQIAVDADGNVYAVDHDLGTLSKFDDDGRFVWRAGGAGAEPPLDGILQSVVARPDGRLFQLREDGPLVELDPSTGAVIDAWDPVHPGWVAFDSSGRTYTGDYEPRAVEVFDADRNLLGGTYDPDAWMFIAVGPNDELVGWQESGNSIMRLELDLPAA